MVFLLATVLLFVWAIWKVDKQVKEVKSIRARCWEDYLKRSKR